MCTNFHSTNATKFLSTTPQIDYILFIQVDKVDLKPNPEVRSSMNAVWEKKKVVQSEEKKIRVKSAWKFRNFRENGY